MRSTPTQRIRCVAAALGCGILLLTASPARAAVNGFDGGDADQSSGNCSVVQDWQCLDPDDIVTAADGSGATDDTFAGGSKEHLPNTWAFVTESVQAKTDVLGAWTATESESDGHTFLKAAFLRAGDNGDTYLGIELNQSDETWVNPNGATIPCRTDGDVLISYEVGNAPLIKLYEWAGTGPVECPDGATGTWNGGSSLLLGGEAAVNETGPITNYLDTGLFGTTFAAERFGETALDLRAIADVVDYPGACAYFRQITVKTRSSSEVTSTLQDWVQGQDALARSCETPGGGPPPVDTTPPAAPTMAGPARACLSGVVLSGTAEPGSTVSVFEGDDFAGFAEVAGDGTWSLTLQDLDEGVHVFTADATDVAGNTSTTRSPAVQVEIDLTAPDAATVSASSPESGVVVLSGTTTPGTEVTLLEGGSVVATVVADSSGDFTTTLNDVAPGAHSYAARVSDGCQTTTSAPASVTVPEPPDTTPPGIPTLSAPAQSCQADVTLSGTGEPGATIDVYDGTDLVGSVVAAGDGTWSLPLVGLSDGTHSYTADATDPALNTSSRSAAVEVAIDTTALAAPTLSASSSEAGVVVLSGTTVPGAEVTLREGDTVVATVTADGSGAYSATLNGVSSGDHAYTARVTDDCDRSTTSVPASVNVPVPPDVTPPAAPTISAPADSCDADVTLSGTGEPGATINVYDGTELVGSTTAAGDGSWSLPLTDLADGNHSFTADATDAADNTSVRSTAAVVAVDATAPAAPTLAASSPASGIVVLSGTTVPDAEVALREGDTVVATVTANGSGAYTATLNDVPVGPHTYTARVTDDCDRSTASAPASATVAAPTTGTTPPPPPPPPPPTTPRTSPPVTPPTIDPSEQAISEVILGETPEATGCALKPFKAYVQRKRVRKVRYMVNGKRAVVVRRADSIGRFVGVIDPVALGLGAGQHKLTARVFFRRKTGRKPITLSLRFRRCDICLSRRSFKIRVKNLRNGEKPVRAKVFVNGKRVKVIKRKRLRSRVVLKGLPKGTYRVVIKARTNRGRVVTDVRTYRTCVGKNTPK